jgi:hypothetical protein
MCDIVNNTSNLDMGSFIIGKSKLLQKDIIIKTRECIYKNNKIPSPYDLDKDVSIIQINPCIFKQVIKIIENLNEKNIFNDFKVFFTDDLNIKQIKTFRIFDKIIKNKTIITYNYTFNNIEKDIYNKYYINYVNKCKDNIRNLFINQ